ncbi:hypothetical protein L1887_35817 [Cichorium endivia]|nr:hypothetical protein L1887_35817 [Cichorium endivia]
MYGIHEEPEVKGGADRVFDGPAFDRSTDPGSATDLRCSVNGDLLQMNTDRTEGFTEIEREGCILWGILREWVFPYNSFQDVVFYILFKNVNAVYYNYQNHKVFFENASLIFFENA